MYVHHSTRGHTENIVHWKLMYYCTHMIIVLKAHRASPVRSQTDDRKDAENPDFRIFCIFSIVCPTTCHPSYSHNQRTCTPLHPQTFSHSLQELHDTYLQTIEKMKIFCIFFCTVCHATNHSCATSRQSFCITSHQ